ncbi:MAG: PSD1 and planctomycete cytochrome C domain-containing protein, partial [Planctomycetaceae bacterium]
MPAEDSAEERQVAADGVAAEHDAFFNESVLPILQTHCFKCHADKQEKGGFRLDLRSRLIAGGESGAVIDFESPEESVLLQAIRYEGYEMPPRGKLPEAEIATLEKWVSLGAPYPADRIGDMEEQKPEAPGADVSEQDRQFWSFRPIAKVIPPGMSGHPIDAFVDERLMQRKIEPVPPASPRELIRRLSYDLTGLPPSESLQKGFEADPSELHYLKIVDRMLASPAYGERWARHWLDLVRWAETNSYERDGDKPEAWRYRSYVIDSFNRDRPYDEFIAQQLAGDEMPFSEEAMIATGYYRLGIWDDEPADPKQALYDDLDDLVTVTGQVFLGLTVNCARCHDHKIDPIRQSDYYRLLAFFSGINRFGIRSQESVEEFSLRPLVPPSEQTQASKAITEFRQELSRLDKRIHDVERAAKPHLLPVEHQEFMHEVNRVRVLRGYVGKHFTKEEIDAYEADLAARRTLNQNRPREIARALVVTEQGSEARPTFVLTRGNPNAEAEPVVPGFLEVLGGGDAKVLPTSNPATSGRRSALAKWIVDPQTQPMTARVMANRVWQYHFGRGLVRTPSDFGFSGSPPTHPELLDYLASYLIENDWHLKPLHRLMVTSEVYRRSSRQSDTAYAADPENDLFWRFDPRRLSAEEVRDSLLAVSGRLDRRVGGRSMYPFLEAEVLAGQSQPGQGWHQSSEADRARRSIYVFTKRSLAVPLLASFDAADTDFTCPVRFAT